MVDVRYEADVRQVDPGLHEALRERPRLIGVAYRLLGSLVDAEDVVQETYVRWSAMTPQERAAIESPGGWLTTVASRICLDVLRSARVRREHYVGQWLPEPLPEPSEWGHGRPADAGIDPADRVSMDESISMALLVVLDAMTPAERVAFILHDVFGYTFAAVAEIVGRSPAACRQLASSARRRVRTRGSPSATSARRADIVGEFKQAWEAADIAALVRLLDPDATVIADGGGLVSALLHPVQGAEAVARTFVDIANRAQNLVVLERTVNGQPGLVTQQGGATATVMAFDVPGARITQIWAVRNPAKLRPWTTDHRHPSASEPAR